MKIPEIIISIKPKWCDLIISGKKTWEIRKTRPNIIGPARVFLYKTKSGKVIAEFTLRECKCIQAWIDSDGEKHLGNTIGIRHCVDDDRLFYYLYKETKTGKPYSAGWAWHIEDLIVYEEAKALDLYFGIKQPPMSWCYVRK